MLAILLGAISALAFGVADFLASRNACRLGADRALCGMLAIGAVGLTIYSLASGVRPPDNWIDLSFIFLHGVAVALALLLFFAALAQGPVSVVAPIVGAHPVLVVAFAALSGRVPSAGEFTAMACVIVGVALVSAITPNSNVTDRMHDEIKAARITLKVLFLALFASAIYAIAVVAGQESAARSGHVATLWLGRLAGLAFIAGLLIVRRHRFTPSMFSGWVAFAIIAQGALDATGFLFLLSGGNTANPEYTAVVSSTFSVVTVALASVFLKERMSMPQFAGLMTIVAGIVLLGLAGA